jgi:ankyrin repeat protein
MTESQAKTLEVEVTEMVQYLLEAGADATSWDKEGSTVLHRAAAGGNEAVVKFFMEVEDLITAKDFHGLTHYIRP